MLRRERGALTFDQAQQALAVLPSPVREMAFLSMTTSLNVAELCGLRWKRVNLSGDWLLADGEPLAPWSLRVAENYYRNRYGSVKTGRRNRIVPIPAVAAPLLAELRRTSKYAGPDDPVFACSTGRPVDAHNTNSRVLAKIGRALGVPVSWHVLRHTCATLAEVIGMARSDREAMMGHAAGGRMLDRYTHGDIERRRAGVNEMAARLVAAAGVVQ